MNYLILKTIVDSTLQNYNTTNPSTKVGENNISIIHMWSKGIDLLIRNPHTNQEVTVHAEVNFMDGPLPPNFSVADMAMTKGKVNDSDVTEVHQALKKTASVADFFNE